MCAGMPTTHWRDLLHDAATPSRLIPAVSSGFVIALLVVILELSFASLIFSGPLASFAPSAAGLTLFGGFAMCLVVALFSSFPPSVCLPQDAPAAVMASVAAGIAAATLADAGTANPAQAQATVAAAMGLSTVATAAAFLILGRFGLGNLMRYMPYPVVGGFMAGIGWLLVQGSVGITTGVSLGFATLPQLLTVDKLLRLLPAVLLTLALLSAMRRWNSPFVLPGTLALALGAFGLYLVLTGQTRADAAQAGLLLGGMPEGSMLWPVFTPADLALIRWDALWPQVPQLCTIPLVAAISFLLNASGMETAAKSDLDLRREMYVNAAANLVGGAGGSHAGYTALSLSLLGPKTGSSSRLVGLSCALFIGAATFLGASVLGLFPRFILGGMVLFLGVATLLDWALDVRRQVGLVEYGLILSILCAIGFFGFLTGVGFGLVMATVIFVIKYSHLPVVRQDTDATALSSTRSRSVPDRHILRERGKGIRVLRITGYLFFGSANVLSRTVSGHLAPQTGAPPSHLVLDFAEVDGFDSSAVNCFLRLLQRCAAAGCEVVFAAAPRGLEEQMRRSSPQDAGAARFLPDLDRALEWCEDAVLARHEPHPDDKVLETLFERSVDDMMLHLEAGERFEALLERLHGHLERRAAKAGEVILTQGEVPQGVWLLISGQADELARDGREDAVVRLRGLGPGDVAGTTHPERALPAPASLVAVADCALGFLSAGALRGLEATDPATALAFYSLFTPLVEARVAESAQAQR